MKADAIVTGFAKSPYLVASSLASLRALKRQNILRNIHYVTWDSPELDPYVAPVLAMPDVHVVRVRQPEVEGTANQRGATYQIHNLDAALTQVAEEDTLVLKTRLDFIADAGFLRDKIVRFEELCAVPDCTVLGVKMPRPVLHNKIWIPWAESNHPFFYDDATFLGTKRDLRKLVTELTAEDFEILGRAECKLFPHVVRYARIFTAQYPIFARYLRDYRYFVNDIPYRNKFLTQMLRDAFFLHQLVAHAWILYSQFHVDAGETGDILFYPNNVNRDVDWSNPQTFCLSRPYDRLSQWRDGTQPQRFFPSIRRPYGRLMDDAWQTALFTRVQPDLPRDTLVGLLANIAACGDGRFAQIEDNFYRGLATLYHENWPPQPAMQKSA